MNNSVVSAGKLQLVAGNCVGDSQLGTKYTGGRGEVSTAAGDL